MNDINSLFSECECKIQEFYHMEKTLSNYKPINDGIIELFQKKYTDNVIDIFENRDWRDADYDIDMKVLLTIEKDTKILFRNIQESRKREMDAFFDS